MRHNGLSDVPQTGNILPASAQFVTPAAMPSHTPATPMRSTATAPVPAPLPVQNRSYRLKTLTAPEFEKKLLDKFGRRFVPVEALPHAEKNPMIVHYQLPVRDGSRLRLTLDRQHGIVSLSAVPHAVEASLQLVRLLDVKDDDQGNGTDYALFSSGNYKAVTQTVDVIEMEMARAQNAPQNSVSAQSPRIAQNMPNPPEQDPYGNQNVLQWEAGQGAPGLTQGMPEGQPNAMGMLDPNTANLFQGMQNAGIIGPVQIQVIDELGTLVVRGNKKDVALVMEMIRQIESISTESEPEITLFRMRQTDAARVAEIVRQLYNQIYLARRGIISITALNKPNAILMIGQNESIRTAVELIKKLDVPSPPTEHFIVIRLRNASSDTVKQQIDEFYAVNGTLSPQVRVTSDFRTNALIIQGAPRDLTEVAAMIRKIDTPSGDAVNIFKTFQLKNALASDLAPILQSAITGTTSTTGTGSNTTNTRIGSRNAVLELATVDTQAGTSIRSGVLSDVRVTADSRSNTLLVSSPPETMPLVEALIKQLDQLPVAESQVKVFNIVHSDAYALRTMLQELFGSTTSGTGGMGGQSTSSSSAFATTRAGTGTADSTLVGIRFTVDTRSNSIIATGSASDLALVEAILIRLDEEDLQNRVVRVVRLRNAPADQVATTISNYMSSERTLENQSSGTYYPKSPLEQYQKEVIVVAETVTNSVLVSTTPRYFEEIMKIITQLDERPPSVFIEVLIAEVTLTNGCDFGTELGIQDSILFDRSNPVMNAAGAAVAGTGEAIPGFDFVKNALGNNVMSTDNSIVGTQGVTSLGLNRTGSSGNGGFIFSASGESLSVLIRALEERKKVQILSRPTITTLDNKQAQLQIGQQVPYITQTNMATNSNNVSNSTDFIPTGVVLDVTPRVTADGMVVMDIYVERSRTGPESEGTVIAIQNNQPLRQARIEITMAKTMLNVMSGQTVILGGLIHETKTHTEVGVPGLNRIPILKYMFNYTSTSTERKELVIIMTPTVIHDEMDVELIKQQELARMNWCAADVARIGRMNVRGRCDTWYAHETEIVPMENVVVPSEEMLPTEEKIKRSLPNPMIPPAPSLAPEREP